jgi:hypothetical protein
VGFFKKLGVKVEVIDARDLFFGAFGDHGSEESALAITAEFYKDVFGNLREQRGDLLLLGTI